ncbi:MAG: hypothetical protein Q7S55_05565 [Nanoarchaeota archaeon]|nr:hypothetical protein [Nanoarchaeota archaeon]
MSKVQIYDTPEEMWEQLGQEVCDTNLRTRETLDDLYEKAMLEYKEKSGFNGRFLEAQQKKSQRTILSPAKVHLPKSEQEKFNRQYRDLGKGLELTILVSLFTVGNEYIFGEGNRGELPNSFDEGSEYDNIASLAQGVKEELSKVTYFGIRFTPAFYTTREEVPLIPEEISNNPEGFLRHFTEDAKKDSALPAEVKELFFEGLRDLVYCKDKIRGLTDQECAEFERLYNPNTP